VAVTVLLVDDLAELRVVVRQALRLRGGFEVVAEADGGAAAIEAARQHQPDVVVLDLGLPDLAGREVLTGLRRVAPNAQVVVYTGSAVHDSEYVMERVEGYVHKDQNLGYLIDLISDLGRRRHQTASIEVGPDRRGVAEARRFIADQCRRWGCIDAIDNAQVVVSELVTNALVHAGTRCEVSARLAQGILRLEVTDRGSGMPDPQAATTRDEHGRGLLLVSMLCLAWGVDALPGGTGKVVWAEMLALSDPAAGPPVSGKASAPSGGGADTRGDGGDSEENGSATRASADRNPGRHRRTLRPTARRLVSVAQ